MLEFAKQDFYYYDQSLRVRMFLAQKTCSPFRVQELQEILNHCEGVASVRRSHYDQGRADSKESRQAKRFRSTKSLVDGTAHLPLAATSETTRVGGTTTRVSSSIVAVTKATSKSTFILRDKGIRALGLVVAHLLTVGALDARNFTMSERGVEGNV